MAADPRPPTASRPACPRVPASARPPPHNLRRVDEPGLRLGPGPPGLLAENVLRALPPGSRMPRMRRGDHRPVLRCTAHWMRDSGADSDRRPVCRRGSARRDASHDSSESDAACGPSLPLQNHGSNGANTVIARRLCVRVDSESEVAGDRGGLGLGPSRADSVQGLARRFSQAAAARRMRALRPYNAPVPPRWPHPPARPVLPVLGPPGWAGPAAAGRVA